MPEPHSKKSWLDEDKSVDPYRSDEDSGGAGAPPLDHGTRSPRTTRQGKRPSKKQALRPAPTSERR